MEYRAAMGRCAIDVADLPVDRELAFELLNERGFQRVSGTAEGFARACLGAPYERGVLMRHAPMRLDCSSLAKWVYGMLGIWIPRLSLQQSEYGLAVDPRDVQPGDLVFCTGRLNRYRADPERGVGHVGIYTERGTIIHAANPSRGVVEDASRMFADPDSFRGVRRLLPAGGEVISLIVPEDREVESSDDLHLALQKWAYLAADA